MSAQELNGIAAIIGGAVLALLFFVPVAARHYRRDGHFGPGDLLALIVVPTYGLALWTYTLLPLPDPVDIVCTTAQLHPLASFDDVVWSRGDSVIDLLRDPMVLQVVLNVAFFVPLGVILRWRWGRGLLSAAMVGFVVSLLIETTQLTGTWGIYGCSYRLFDVDDLLTNTTGAVLGSLLSIPFLSTGENGTAGGRTPERPRVPTLGRRVVAMTSDLLTMVLVGAVALIAWRTWLLEFDDIAFLDMTPLEQGLVQWGVPLALEAVVVLGAGRTIGEVVVRVRTRASTRWWTPVARLIKLATGVGALAVLAAWDALAAEIGLVVFLVVTVLAAVLTRDHRGLANAVARLEVDIDAPVATEDPEPRNDEVAHLR